VNDKEKSYLRNFNQIYDTARMTDHSVLTSPKPISRDEGLDSAKGRNSTRKIISKHTVGAKSSFFGKMQV